MNSLHNPRKGRIRSRSRAKNGRIEKEWCSKQALSPPTKNILLWRRLFREIPAGHVDQHHNQVELVSMGIEQILPYVAEKHGESQVQIPLLFNGYRNSAYSRRRSLPLVFIFKPALQIGIPSGPIRRGQRRIVMCAGFRPSV